MLGSLRPRPPGMFGFLPFRNISKSGSLTAVAACVALSAAWLALDEEERRRDAAHDAREEDRAREARRRWAAVTPAAGSPGPVCPPPAAAVGPANLNRNSP